ncbi:MAG: GIY-YIG nuclease family protein [Clostridia bacterium]|nr:GIY-YIG nuclease family protein [Clostridia bacterium]
MAAKKVWCIYKHTNKINGKGYIGKAIFPPQSRWGINGKKYANQPAFSAAINKYGWENFEHAILLTDLTAEEAIEAEIRLIAEHNTFCGITSGNGYNMTRGGEGMSGWHHSLDEIKRRSGDQSVHARPVVSCIDGERFGSATSAAEKYGINRSSISAAANGSGKSAGKRIWCYSDVWDNMSSEERNNYIQQRLVSNKKGSRHHKSVAVINCLTGDTFLTITEAQEAYGCNTIHHAINDYDYTKKANGQVWCRLDIWNSFSEKEKEAYIYDKLNARRGEFNASARAVVNLITEEVFPTMKEAAEQYSCNAAKICACCKKTNRTAGGQVWIYHSEYLRMSEIEKARFLEECLCKSENPAKYGLGAKGIINLTKNLSYKTLKDAADATGLSTYTLRELCKRKKCSYSRDVWILEEEYALMDENEISEYQQMCLANSAMIKHNRRIRNDSTGEIFENAKMAAEAYNCDYSRLMKCCKGIVRSVGGYAWSFADENQNNV